jgi:urease gamma subunit
MTNAIKGVLLSGLVFPGLGQIALKRYQRGVVFMLATVAGLVVIVVNAAREARRILGTIEAGGGVIDQDAMSRAIDQATAWSGNLAVNLFLVAITFWEMVSGTISDLAPRREPRRLRQASRSRCDCAGDCGRSGSGTGAVPRNCERFWYREALTVQQKWK